MKAPTVINGVSESAVHKMRQSHIVLDLEVLVMSLPGRKSGYRRRRLAGVSVASWAVWRARLLAMVFVQIVFDWPGCIALLWSVVGTWSALAAHSKSENIKKSIVYLHTNLKG